MALPRADEPWQLGDEAAGDERQPPAPRKALAVGVAWCGVAGRRAWQMTRERNVAGGPEPTSRKHGQL